MILQHDNQARRDRMLRWLRANGVTEPADQIKDGVEADEAWITYELVAAPDGPSRLVRVPHRVSLWHIPLTAAERQARADDLRKQAADLLHRADIVGGGERLRTTSSGPEQGPFDGLDTYAHPMSVMDALASALMCLGDGLWSYTPNPDTEKMIRRGLKGWAEKHERPTYYPWTWPLFNQFWGDES